MCLRCGAAGVSSWSVSPEFSILFYFPPAITSVDGAVYGEAAIAVDLAKIAVYGTLFCPCFVSQVPAQVYRAGILSVNRSVCRGASKSRVFTFFALFTERILLAQCIFVLVLRSCSYH